MSLYWNNRFDEMNKKYFGGKLPKIQVTVESLPGAYGLYYSAEEGSEARIVLDNSTTINQRLNVLLHEMCHHAADLEDPNALHHHGKTWKKWMKICGFRGKIHCRTALRRFDNRRRK